MRSLLSMFTRPEPPLPEPTPAAVPTIYYAVSPPSPDSGVHVRWRAEVRRSTKAEWLACDPKLRVFELAYETDTDRFKLGDGDRLYSELPYYAKNP